MCCVHVYMMIVNELAAVHIMYKVAFYDNYINL